MARTFLNLLAVLLWFAAALQGAEPSTRPLAPYEPPDGKTYHGVCLSGFWNPDEFAGNLQGYRKLVPAPPLVLHSWFAHCQEQGKWRTYHWMNQTPDGGHCCGAASGYFDLDRHWGLVPVVAWTWMNYGDEEHSPRLQDLVAGKYDWYLDDWIAGIKEYHDPVFIRLSHEMDGDWYPYSEGYTKNPTRNTAGDYVAYWRYVVDRFRRAGVNNVAWVWCANADHSHGKGWRAYYPGDGYVDWLALDVYSAIDPRAAMGEFVQMFGSSGKPIMIPEGGTAPEMSKWNRKFSGDAAWVNQLFDAVESTPRVKAICWFQFGLPWNLERVPEQAAVFRDRMKADRYATSFVAGSR